MNAIEFYIIVISCFLISCSAELKPIDYGTDKCDNCEMTIVDNKFGAEIVNIKGKTFKFDAVECLINYFAAGKIKKNEISKTLVTHYNKPGVLTEAGRSYFLISDNLPSPMGAFLSAYENEATANKFKEKYDGVIYNWDEIFDFFHKKIHKRHN